MINSKEHSTEKQEAENREAENREAEKPGRHLGGLYSTLISAGLHIAVFLGLIVLMRIAEAGSGSSYGGYYVDMVSPKGPSGGSLNAQALDRPLKEKKADKEDPAESLPDTKKSTQKEKETIKANKEAQTKDEEHTPVSHGGNLKGGYYSMNSGGFDSTGLAQVYQEPTLKVTLRYPSGWVYLDQQRKKKLDGITFWASAGSYNPPPYIHVEVVEKYIFNPEQYRYKYDFGRFECYYNDPEELENQVSQTIYIRTGDEEDYSIKLIMQGHEAFKEFQPVFFAMVKSFRFGSSLF